MFRSLLYGYVGFVFAWGTFGQLLGDANWLFYCLNRAAPFLYIPGVLVPLLTIACRQHYSLVLLSMTPLILFLVLFWPYVGPRNSTIRPGDISTMTYNILCTNTNVAAIARVVRQHTATLVAFQEMTNNQFSSLSKLLQKEYPYRIISHQVPCGSTAIFSQLPFTNTQTVDLSTDRPATIATVFKDKTPIVFISAHLLPMYRARIQPLADVPGAINQFVSDKLRQIEILINTLKEFESTRIIIGCDCNTVLTHSAYSKLKTTLEDSASVTAARPSAIPNKRNNNPYQLDYIFFQGALTPVANYRSKDSGGSDHLPVITRFVLN